MMNAELYRSSAAVLCAAAVFGCERPPLEPQFQDERTSIVLAFTGASLTLQAQAGTTVIRECDAGGRMVLEGTESSEIQGDVRVIRWQRVVRHENCGINIQGEVAVATGEMQLTGEAHFGPPANGVAPLLHHQSRQLGSVTTTWHGETQRCDYDLNVIYDVADRVYRLTGLACGRSVQLQLPALR